MSESCRTNTVGFGSRIPGKVRTPSIGSMVKRRVPWSRTATSVHRRWASVPTTTAGTPASLVGLVELLEDRAERCVREARVPEGGALEGVGVDRDHRHVALGGAEVGEAMEVDRGRVLLDLGRERFVSVEPDGDIAPDVGLGLGVQRGVERAAHRGGVAEDTRGDRRRRQQSEDRDPVARDASHAEVERGGPADGWRRGRAGPSRPARGSPRRRRSPGRAPGTSAPPGRRG